MYIRSAYLFHEDNDVCDLRTPFRITSCGIYRLRTVPEYFTKRPNGRQDYQLLYVAAGKVHFYFDRQEVVVPAGHIVVYRPHERQEYVYYGTDRTQVCWMHFTGNDVESVLGKYRFPLTGHTVYVGKSAAFETVFESIIREISTREPQFEAMSSAHFTQLGLLVARAQETHPDVPRHPMSDEVETAKQYFQQHYSEPISISQYAAAHHISTCWFIRSFRALTGQTPLQYIQTVRMDNAAILLRQSQYTVSEVAAMVGVEDPLYFSNLFKKHKGLSPSAYRKQKTPWR